MIVQVSKVMVKELNKQFKDRNWSFCKFDYREADLLTYRTHVNCFVMDSENDWIASKGKMKYIAVVYPDEYYSLPRYLTTNDILKCFRDSDRTFDGFVNEIKLEVEI